MKSLKKRRHLFERLQTALEEANLHTKGEISLKATVIEIPDRPPEVHSDDVTRLRLDNHMSQAVFARLLNVSPKTVQSWEHGTRRPSQAAQRLIQVFRNNPSAVLSVVGMTPTREAAPNTPKQRKPAASKSKKQTV